MSLLLIPRSPKVWVKSEAIGPSTFNLGYLKLPKHASVTNWHPSVSERTTPRLLFSAKNYVRAQVHAFRRKRMLPLDYDVSGSKIHRIVSKIDVLILSCCIGLFLDCRTSKISWNPHICNESTILAFRFKTDYGRHGRGHWFGAMYIKPNLWKICPVTAYIALLL